MGIGFFIVLSVLCLCCFVALSDCIVLSGWILSLDRIGWIGWIGLAGLDWIISAG